MLTPQDIRVLIALHDVPDTSPIDDVANHANVTLAELRDSMRRLALRDVNPDA